MARKRVAILISGRGSNMLALIKAAAANDYPAEIALVVSNDPGAEGLQRATAAGIDTAVIDHRRFGKDRETFERALHDKLVTSAIEIVCLAGFMRLLTPWFVQQWDGRLLNIHPSLLPKYKGLDTHARVLAARDTHHGASVHFVTAELDGGPVIMQGRLKVRAGDTPGVRFRCSLRCTAL